MSSESELTPDQYLALFKLTPRKHVMALKAGASLYAHGRHEEAIAVWHLGYDLNSAVRTAHSDPSEEAVVREFSLQADTALRSHLSELHRKTVDIVADELGGLDLSRVRNAVWIQFADLPVEYRNSNQRPSVLYLPDLDPVPVVQNSSMPWVANLEAAFPDIRAEFDAAMQTAKPSPYIHQNTIDENWQILAGKLDWGSIHLFANARPTATLVQFPKTMAALEQVNLSRRDGVPIELFFSILKPGAHIPPHFGQANSRLTAHLPIHVPGECGIRIETDTHEWHEGKLLAFDDSFEHEAWNRSDQPRAVLIFEIPHPDLSAEESAAIARVYEAFDAWVGSRRTILKI
jgi:hypothetical protein